MKTVWTALVGIAWSCSAWSQVYISEVMPWAAAGFPDEDGEEADWIEVANSGAAAIDLGGWGLSDDQAVPAKWLFPSVDLAPGEFLIVFSSGKDRGDPAGELHTNFKLDQRGEEVVLSAPGGGVSGAPILLRYPKWTGRGVSIGAGEVGGLRYFTEPTPGQSNGDGYLGFVAAPDFSVGRGLYTTPVSVSVSTETQGADIVYTVDGTVPLTTSAPVGVSGFTVSQSTVVRARAFLEGWIPSRTVTQTYLFLDDIIRQPARAKGTPNGSFPGHSFNRGQGWGSTAMSQSVVNADPGSVIAALGSLPSLCLTAEPEGLFDGGSGILANAGVPRLTNLPDPLGNAWEREGAVELLSQDGTGGEVAPCGVRAAGRVSRLSSKHPLNVEFRDRYGASEGKIPFVPQSEVTRFSDFRLRPVFWSGKIPEQEWFNDLQRLMSGSRNAQNGTFVHVYINAIYWGVFNLTEIGNSGLGETHYGDGGAPYTGGKQRDQVIVEGNPRPGLAWDTMLTLPGLETSEQIPLLRTYLNLEQYIDYMILTGFTGHFKSEAEDRWVGSPERGVPFRGFQWDLELFAEAEETMFGSYLAKVGNRRPLWSRLVGNPEFIVRFSDRVQRHFFDGGPLTVENLVATHQARADEVRAALLAEQARWFGFPTLESYNTGRESFREWAEIRSPFVVGDFRDNGLFRDAPVFSVPPGEIDLGSMVMISDPLAVPGAEIYFTTDGSDPRLPGTADDPLGLPAPGANLYTGGVEVTSNSVFSARVRDPDGSWGAIRGSVFTVGPPPVVISEVMYHPSDPSPEEVAAGFANDDDFEFIEVWNRGSTDVDLAGYRFSDGISFEFPSTAVPAGGRVVVVKNADAFSFRYPSVTAVAGSYLSGALSNGGERVALEAADGREIMVVDYSDDFPWPEGADGGGYSLTARRTPGEILSLPDAWRHSSVPGGTPGGADSVTFADWMNSRGGSDPLGDADGDGVSDLYAFATGADLGDQDDPAIFVEAVGDASGDGRALMFRRRTGGDEVTVIPELSDDLDGWEPLVSSSVVAITPLGDGMEEVEMMLDPVPLDIERMFVRLRVSFP